jgi:hypothetical protein
MLTAAIRPLGRTAVHVRVGKGLQEFAIHKALICHHSPYFRAAFTYGFEETETGIMKIPNTEVRIFDLFFNWLYTQTLWDESADESEWPTMENLLKLWAFADMARIPRLMNQCLDTLKSISDALDEVFTGIAWVWKKSTLGSAIRRFLIDSIVWELNAEDLANELNLWPAEARVEIVLAMGELIASQLMADGKEVANPLDDMSKYHQPEESK